MWLCFNDAFVSVVQHENPGLLSIRSRRREHLQDLIPGCKIAVNAGTDYKYRTQMSREEFADLVAKRVENIDYSNFKNSVDDDDLHDLYAGFWNSHYRYQK